MALPPSCAFAWLGKNILGYFRFLVREESWFGGVRGRHICGERPVLAHDILVHGDPWGNAEEKQSNALRTCDKNRVGVWR